MLLSLRLPQSAYAAAKRGAGHPVSFASLVEAALLSSTAAAGKPIEIWFQDEARAAGKGTHAYIWAAAIGSHPAMVRDNRHDSAYLFGAVCWTRRSVRRSSCRRPTASDERAFLGNQHHRSLLGPKRCWFVTQFWALIINPKGTAENFGRAEVGVQEGNAIKVGRGRSKGCARIR